MNENINLCKILKGHEGETFYYYGKGDVILQEIQNRYDKPYQLKFFKRFGYTEYLYLNIYGTFHSGDNSLMLFPSKDQRDWNKWIREQNLEVPKTWSEIIKTKEYNNYRLHYVKSNDEDYYTSNGVTPIEKSALALLKIHQLIEVGYGGNVTYEEWDKNYTCFVICYDTMLKRFVIGRCVSNIRHLAFHTEEQAKEFLSKPENVQLLKDYFMI